MLYLLVDNPGIEQDGYAVFAVLPGFWTYFGLVMSWAQAGPFAYRRTFLLSTLQTKGYLPLGEALVLKYETNETRWWSECLLMLFAFGLVVRAVSILLFTLRPVDKKAALRQGVEAARGALARARGTRRCCRARCCCARPTCGTGSRGGAGTASTSRRRSSIRTPSHGPIQRRWRSMCASRYQT